MDNQQSFSEEQAALPLLTQKRSLWVKAIPRINKIFFVLSLVLVFGVDLYIIIKSPDLASYWYIMLGVLAVFCVFIYYENSVFRRKFSDGSLTFDKWILVFIIVRNLIFLLNFIPVIQLLGLALLGVASLTDFPYAGLGILIVYLILMRVRYKRTLPSESGPHPYRPAA